MNIKNYSKKILLVVFSVFCLLGYFSNAQEVEVKQDEPDVAALKNYFSHKPYISKIIYSELAGDGNTELATYVGASCDDGFYVRKIVPGENYDMRISEKNRMQGGIFAGRFKDISWQINGFDVKKSISPAPGVPDICASSVELSKTMLLPAITLGSCLLEPGSAQWDGNNVSFRPSAYMKQLLEQMSPQLTKEQLALRSNFSGKVSVEKGKINRVLLWSGGFYEYEYEDSPDRPNWFPKKVFQLIPKTPVSEQDFAPDFLDTVDLVRATGPSSAFLIKKVEFFKESDNYESFLPEYHIDENISLLTLYSNSVVISEPDLKSQKAVDSVKDELKKFRPEPSRLNNYLWKGIAIAGIFGFLILIFYKRNSL